MVMAVVEEVAVEVEVEQLDKLNKATVVVVLNVVS